MNWKEGKKLNPSDPQDIPRLTKVVQKLNQHHINKSKDKVEQLFVIMLSSPNKLKELSNKNININRYVKPETKAYQVFN